MDKINHLLLVLPNLTFKIIKELNMFLKCIWNGSVDRIKRDVITKEYTEDGLTMFKLQYIIHALKASWISRYIQKTKQKQNKNKQTNQTTSKWTHILKIAYQYIYNFVKIGVSFINIFFTNN